MIDMVADQFLQSLEALNPIPQVVLLRVNLYCSLWVTGRGAIPVR